MYNYHADIVWVIDAVLAISLVLTFISIFLTAELREYFWEKRRSRLLKIKNNVSEMILSGKGPSAAVCQPFADEATPEQFLDVETNRSMGAVFFNDSEKQLFKSCFLTPEHIARITKLAKWSGNKWLRIEAILSLGHSQLEPVIDTIRGPLLGRDRDVAHFSMIALGQIKTVASARALLELLKKDPSSGYGVASIIESFPKDITDDVIKLTDDDDPRVRFWAVTIFSRFAAVEHIKKIEEFVKDPNAELRAAACDCLGNTGSREARSALLKCLKDDSWLVKKHAIYALEKVMGDEAIKDVAVLINSSSWSVVDAVKDVMTKHIKASLPFIEGFISGNDYIPKKYSIIILKAAPEGLDPSTKAKAAEILSKIEGGA
ncbi:MAG: HEAT repeat domain-containing protein [Candidatus Omnitrophota bacterium]|jgi:HEAT repeat protein